MYCPGCYKPVKTGYCLSCRRHLFNGARVSPVLDFDIPQAGDPYQEKIQRHSISGAQPKHSLQLDNKKLVLTGHAGQYILKPIPPAMLIKEAGEAPANEHLTMQIAARLFGINTAANGLVYFKNGTPAYITRRFDVRPDGTRHLQEDMAQISGRNRQINGEHFKYEGSYEEIGRLIRQHVAAYLPALETYFRLVLFNYLFSNGDAHLKNFSLIQSDEGDYWLSPAYDLMCTVLHTPNETDTALSLFEGDINTPFYETYGYFGRPHFEELAGRLGLLRGRAATIIGILVSGDKRVEEMVQQSFLANHTKILYLAAYREKRSRFS